MDDKIKLKQEQEEFKAELKSMCEAALWRRSQGEFPNVEDWRFLVKFVQVLSSISMRNVMIHKLVREKVKKTERGWEN
ncbi:hypothetical protein Fmac_012228 [Flemingia macrophylla]|uniref:Uncharacterized protein n=1 Tax=Flemingia macrophylla TaxID=520843 RepID=A0ABD1MPP5_9FABA